MGRLADWWRTGVNLLYGIDTSTETTKKNSGSGSGTGTGVVNTNNNNSGYVNYAPSDPGTWYNGTFYSSSSAAAQQEAKDKQNKANTEALAKDSAEQLGKTTEANLQQIEAAVNANNALAESQSTDAHRNNLTDWFQQQSKALNSAKNIQNSSGNTMYGSGMDALKELGNQVSDNIDVDTLQSLRSNIQNIYDTAFSQNFTNWQQFQNTVNEAESKFKQLGQNLAADVGNINTDFTKDYFKDGKLNWDSTALNPIKQAMDAITARTMAEPIRQTQGYFRPDGNNVQQQNNVNNTGTANQSYWQALQTGYDGRK